MAEAGRFAVVFDVLDQDVETLIRALARSRDVLLVSDVRSPRVEALQALTGADLIVASHRLIDSGHGLRHSDFDLAARMAASHARSPLDAIVYASDAILDLGWYEPALADLPRGRLLRGLLMSSEETLADTRTFVDLGPTSVALWGDAATSDFVVACRPEIGALGWVDVPSLTAPLSEWRSELATVLDGRGLTTAALLAEAEQASAHTDGLLFVVVSDVSQGEALQATLPGHLAERVLAGTPGDPWIARVIGEEGLVPVDAMADLFDDFQPVRRETPGSTVMVSGEMDELGETIDRLIAGGSTEVLVAAARSENLAHSMLGKRLLNADLGFMAAHRAPMGDLDPGKIRNDVVAIGPRARRAARLAVDSSPDFRTLVFRLTEPSLTTSAVVGLVPNMDGPHPGSLRTTRSPVDLGLRLTPSLLPLPNVPAEPHPPAPEVFDAKSWVGHLGWGTRSRLALPWRWNLLPRAMKGRW